MGKTIDFYYDFISPASYFAFMRLGELCERTGARINYCPMLLGGVLKAVGTAPPVTVPAKWAWYRQDFQRCADYYGIPYQLNPHFPFNTVNAMRGCFWALEAGCIEQYNRAMYRAAWTEGRDLGSPEVLAEVLTDAGLNAEDVLAAVTEQGIKEMLFAATDAAVERGVFGAPTFFVGDEIFFGQDRMDFVARALA